MYRHLLSLVKPRIAALLSLTGVTATFAAGGLPIVDLAAFALAGLGMAGGGAALNCWYDRDIDGRMARTADRPLVSGELHPHTALAFAAALIAGATALALWRLPTVSVVYMWLGLLAYVVVYTVWLKRRSWLGVVLGGSAGSFPVLAGWTAVRPLGTAALALAALVFLWTPAHAWALAVVYREDFAAVGIPTLPVVASPRRVRRAVLTSALLTVGLGLAAGATGGTPFLAATLVASPPFALAAWRFARAGGAAHAVRTFFASNAYLAVVFVGWGVAGQAAGTGATLAVAAVGVAAFAWLARARPELNGVRMASGPDWSALAGRWSGRWHAHTER